MKTAGRLMIKRVPCSLLLTGLIAIAGTGVAGCGEATPPLTAAAPATTSATSPTIPSPSEAPTLDADQRDAAFVNALTSKNLQVGDPQTRTQVAETVCRALDSDVPVPALADQLQEALGGPTPENTGFIIGAATAIYCPNNLPKLKSN